jgi:hypothetical protein
LKRRIHPSIHSRRSNPNPGPLDRERLAPEIVDRFGHHRQEVHKA